MLAALVNVSQARAAALQRAKQAIPRPVQIVALVDTGASCTCVDPSVLTGLQLTATGPITMNTPSTGGIPHTAFQFDVSLIIPGGLPGHPSLIFPNIAVASAELVTQQGFHALIGRDVLGQCILAYNGSTRTFTLAY